MPRIVIATGIADYPNAAAGNSWAFLQWVLGFRAAGWEVMAVESLTSASLVGPDWTPAAPGSSANETHWHATMQRFGLAEHAVLLIDGNSPRLAAARAFARSADLMLNISGHFRSDVLEFPQATKIHLDLDPAFTQIWAETYAVDMNFEGQDVFFSVGSRLGRPDCRAPDCGRTWHPTLPPVVLDYWPDAGPAPSPASPPSPTGMATVGASGRASGIQERARNLTACARCPNSPPPRWKSPPTPMRTPSS
jgi:hypothetical protein